MAIIIGYHANNILLQIFPIVFVDNHWLKKTKKAVFNTQFSWTRLYHLYDLNALKSINTINNPKLKTTFKKNNFS